MTKTYKANTSISINVVLASKKNLHISFITQSDGSSTFTTDCEEIQRAIERHYRFGSLFRLKSVSGSPEKKRTDPDTDDIVMGETNEKDGETGHDETESEWNNDGQRKLDVVNVPDLSAAKDYLADRFGISRTTLRSKKSIVDAAAANGIQLDGI